MQRKSKGDNDEKQFRYENVLRLFHNDFEEIPGFVSNVRRALLTGQKKAGTDLLAKAGA